MARRAAGSVRDGNVIGVVENGGRGLGGPGGKSGRIVLDVRELARLQALLATSRDRVEHARQTTLAVAGGLAALRAGRPDPMTARLVQALFDQLTGPTGLPLAARHLDWEERLVGRTRTLAESAAGDDGRASQADTLAFIGTLGRRIDLPEAAVLEALVAGGLRLHRNRPHQTVLVGELVPARPALPAHQPMGGLPVGPLARFGNGKLPAGRLDGIGGGERLVGPAARHFRRMDAAARAAGIPLPVLNGYRSYAEQVERRSARTARPSPHRAPAATAGGCPPTSTSPTRARWTGCGRTPTGTASSPTCPASPGTGPTARPPSPDQPSPTAAGRPARGS